MNGDHFAIERSIAFENRIHVMLARVLDIEAAIDIQSRQKRSGIRIAAARRTRRLAGGQQRRTERRSLQLVRKFRRYVAKPPPRFIDRLEGKLSLYGRVR